MNRLKLVLLIVVGGYLGWIIGGYVGNAIVPKPKKTYELEMIVLDSLGNEYHNIKQFDHVPTHSDSVEFYK